MRCLNSSWLNDQCWMIDIVIQPPWFMSLDPWLYRRKSSPVGEEGELLITVGFALWWCFSACSRPWHEGSRFKLWSEQSDRKTRRHDPSSFGCLRSTIGNDFSMDCIARMMAMKLISQPKIINSGRYFVVRVLLLADWVAKSNEAPRMAMSEARNIRFDASWQRMAIGFSL